MAPKKEQNKPKSEKVALDKVRNDYRESAEPTMLTKLSDLWHEERE